MPSGDLRKVSQKRQQAGQFRSVYKLIGELGQAAQFDGDVMRRRLDVLEAEVAKLKRPWWRKVLGR